MSKRKAASKSANENRTCKKCQCLGFMPDPNNADKCIKPRTDTGSKCGHQEADHN